MRTRPPSAAVATASAVKVRDRAHERTDLWWVEPVVIAVVLGAFVLYSAYAGLVGTNYYFEPYLSPFYSPCLTANCVHPTLPLVGSYWNLSPAILIVAFPSRSARPATTTAARTNRAFFWSPPACAVPDAHKKSPASTRFPFLSNLHPVRAHLATTLLIFLWWTFPRVQFQRASASARHGAPCSRSDSCFSGLFRELPLAAVSRRSDTVDSFHGKSLRFLLWSWANWLNARHSRWALSSLTSVGLTDVYIRCCDGCADRSEDRLLVAAVMERHDYDVIVVGAGGAGLRAAIEAHALGAKTAIVCKSLLGKAHTVMAEGGMAAALGNVWPEDNWQVHFRDTMRGGKLLNNWRMAQLHAQEAPDRVLELEEWGALFDRTKDGLILQRDFGGHRYARLAHVGDRTGLEMIRTLQDAAVAKGHRRLHVVHASHLLTDASA